MNLTKNILVYIVISSVAFFSFSFNVFGITNLIVSEGTLIPYFDKEIHKYNIYIGENVDYININYTKEETDDYVEGIGKISLKNGINNLKILVKKLNGISEIYTIVAYKGFKDIKDYESATLTNIEIAGYNIEFDENIFEYVINIDEKENELNINYTPKSEYSHVKLVGNTNLFETENIITLTVTSKDEKIANIYTIKANKVISTFNENKVKQNDQNKVFTKGDMIITVILISIVTLLLLFILFKLFFLKKKRITA